MLVKDIMSKKVLSVSKDDNVQKFISLMQKKRIHEVPVLDKNNFYGMISYKDIISKTIVNPEKDKIKKVMNSHPPKVTPDTNVEDAARLLFNTGTRCLPVIDNKKLVGLLSYSDIIKSAINSKEFRKIKAEDVMAPPILASMDTEIGKARVVMREGNVSALPVIDHNGNLGGIVTTFDLLKSIKKHERISWYSAAAQMDKIMRIPLSTIMNQAPVTTGVKTSLTQIVNLMTENKTSTIVILKGKIPEGVVTAKDLLEAYMSTLSKKGVYYDIIGIEKEDSFILDTADRMVRDTIKKIATVYEPQSFLVHVKKHETGVRGRSKYSIRIRSNTNKGMFISQSYDWDLRDAIGEALDKLEVVMFKERDHIKDKSKKNAQLRKNLRR
ncbi:MAG: CBS domain-containing protein [Candidatus Aenigmarchaeota archaeon]|nr:CBS domain-containing protein [Candidatus Aenigmarchaeota archaeon]